MTINKCKNNQYVFLNLLDTEVNETYSKCFIYKLFDNGSKKFKT